MKNILVTGAGSFCAINIIKSLKSTGKYRVIATDIFPESVGVFRADIGYLISKEGGDGRYIEDLLNIVKEQNISLIIPGFDSELPYLLEAKERFEEVGVKVLIGNDTLIKISTDKYRLSYYLKENRFPYLKAYNISEVELALNELSYPFIIKPKFGWGQRDFHLIRLDYELKYVLNAIKDAEKDFFIQEYIDETEGEFTNSISVATDGDILGCICSKRRLVKGDSRIIEIDDFYNIRKQILEIAKIINSQGPLNFQCRLKDNKAYVFEINARFSTTNVVRAACGFNEVDLLVENFLYGTKRYIHQYQKKVALAFLDYVYIDSEDIADFKEKRCTSVSGFINNWL